MDSHLVKKRLFGTNSTGLICLCIWFRVAVSNAFCLRPCYRSSTSPVGGETPYRKQEFITHSGRTAFCLNSSYGGDATTKQEQLWFPEEFLSGAELESDEMESIQASLELQSLQLMANILLDHIKRESTQGSSRKSDHNEAYEIAKGRFQDLCCTSEGELLLEGLFGNVSSEDNRTVHGAIMSLQSLLILGTNFGVKGTPEQFERSVSHLVDSKEDLDRSRSLADWDASSTRRLKYESNRNPGLQLLAELNRKRSAQGAFDFLVKIGAWQPHEDLALLRSGFSLRFTDAELDAAKKAGSSGHDPDELLDIRSNFLDQKVYTIDGASTTEIDDGLAVEVVTKKDGSKSNRFWIHIADADRWAPRDSKIFEVARKRATSLYLPQGSIPMLPGQISSDVMSLNANKERSAVSLGVELASDGSIIDSSIIVTSSKIKVSYRLTYDDVDEMLEDGIAYSEEWELGALYSAAIKRRSLRIRNGSAEGFVPTQIPQFSMSTFSDMTAPSDTGIALNIQVSHNGGKNQSVVSEDDNDDARSYAAPVSSSSMLVTEMMILAGEAMGKFKIREDNSTACENGLVVKNSIRLPFRSQPNADYRSRMREKSIMDDLLAHNIGGGYCHAWFARRFLAPAKVTEVPSAHSGLGIDAYVQWTSPIRRFGDLQVHCAAKRYLRRQKVIKMLQSGSKVPSNLTSTDLGCNFAELEAGETLQEASEAFDTDIDCNDRSGFIKAARVLQRLSQRYWLLEYVKRLDPAKCFDAVVLGCTNPTRRQYAIYVYELGLEWKYVSPVGSLQAGTEITVKATNLFPHNGQMTFVRV